MAVLDIILLILFIPGIIYGLAKGIIKQLVALAAIFMGAFIAGRFAPDLCKVAMLQFGSSERGTYIICFLLIFILTALFMALVGHFITKLFKIANLGWFNRLLGALFAIVSTALILGLLINAFEGLNTSWELVSPDKLAEYKVYNILGGFSSKLLPQLDSFFSQWTAV